MANVGGGGGAAVAYQGSRDGYLGRVTVPEDIAKAGNYSCRGSESYGGCLGLQPEFKSALEAAVKEMVAAHWSVRLSEYGWISRDQAGVLARNGKSNYLDDPVAFRFFGWGLAAEATIKSSSTRPPTRSYTSILEAHGLGRSYHNGKIEYIRPRYYDTSKTADSINVPSSGGSSSASDGAAAAATDTSGASVNSVAYFFANQFQSLQYDLNSELLRGNRALANDEPVFNYVKDAVQSSLRTFASGPDGEFMAWYPDYWGKNDAAYVILEDVELIDLTITQSDNEFYSHVYCSGVDQSGSVLGPLLTQGVVSIESNIDSQMGEWLEGKSTSLQSVSDQPSEILKELIYIPEGEEWKYSPKELYRRYGARPYKEQDSKTLIENRGEGDAEDPAYILPFMKALHSFMKHWANQYQCTLKITFMPDLFPGYRIKLKSYDISMYVKTVSHNMSYTGGFTTDVTCICPVGTLVSGMVNPK